jgi:hypothetical protein
MSPTSLTVPALIHWLDEPPPDLMRFTRPIRIPFRMISAASRPSDKRDGHTPIT